MARNLKDDDERLRRIIMVGDYMYTTGFSTRKTAEYFSKNHFPISNYTVSDYYKRYSELRPDKKDEIVAQIEKNKPVSIEDENVRNRVLKVADLVLAGFTLEEISKNISLDMNAEEKYWVIYRDIHNRLPRIDLEKYEQVKAILKERSLDNLNDKNK